MVTDFGKMYGCKAFRLNDETPVLDFQRVSRNAMIGRQTQLTFDTNVVIGMVRCCEAGDDAADQTLQRQGLLAFVNFMRECHRMGLTYWVSPYFALMEMPATEVEGAVQAIERFPTMFGLGWTDAYNSRELDLSSVGRTVKTDRYSGLPDGERRNFSAYYSGLLLLLLVARDCRELDPAAQFATFLRMSRDCMSIVSSRLIQIARFVLAPAPSDGSEIHGLWKDIVLNFTQREKPAQRYPNSFHQMDKAAMNGAHDLMVLDAALVVEQRGIDGVEVDPWLITGDRKLASLVRQVHHIGPHRSFAGLICAAGEVEHLGGYWRETGAEIAQLAPRMGGKIDFDRLERETLAIRALVEKGIG